MLSEKIKQKVKQLKQQTLVVYFASRDPNLPIYIKIIAILIVAYALSPIDLIPDFIPILGLLDDIIIVPLSLALVIYLTPPVVMQATQLKASQSNKKPISYMAAFVIIVIWLLVLFLSAQWFYNELL